MYGNNGVNLLKQLVALGPIIRYCDIVLAAQGIGIKRSYLSGLLLKLLEAGSLIRIKKGVYQVGEEFSGASIHPFAVASSLVQPSAISGWSALNYHGLTEQIPHRVTLTTSRQIVVPSMRQPQSDTPGVWDVHGIQVEIVIVVPKHFFGFQTIWLGNSQLQIFDQERALLDCFALPRRFGGLVEGLAIVEQHIHRLDLSKLADYSIQYGKASVSKRIGFALEQYAPTHPVVEKFRNIPIQGMRPLDPTRPTRGKRNKRWGLVENLGEP